MKKIFCATLYLLTCSLAFAQSSLPFNHPTDQIAIQLGAIQMGYTTPFVVTTSSNSTVKQKACNALAQGRKAMAATASAPGTNVQGAVNTPAVDTVEFRDQLYQAVENVVTTPLKVNLTGVATLDGGKKVPARASLLPPPNSWMVPVPYALESRSCVEGQDTDLRNELVAAGVLAPANMVTVQGGVLPASSGLGVQTVSTFQIGKYEVTWEEWQNVRDWAVNNGYTDLEGVGKTYPNGSAGNFPVVWVNWYDVVKWCNAKSEKEGLTPVYQISGATYKTGQIAPSVNISANGYRLPSEKEWEWAARGGVSSKGYTYSGSNDVDQVAWNMNNSNSETHAIGTKGANELGIYDMSGNVCEWCEDAKGIHRRRRGAGYNFPTGYCEVTFSSEVDTNDEWPGNGHFWLGFRLAHNSAL